MAGGTDRGDLSHTLAFCLHGASKNDADVYVMINAYWEDLVFAIQEGLPGVWRRVVDTALESPNDISEPQQEATIDGLHYTAAARSVVVLRRKTDTADEP